jgi:hypothetical protein
MEMEVVLKLSLIFARPNQQVVYDLPFLDLHVDLDLPIIVASSDTRGTKQRLSPSR